MNKEKPDLREMYRKAVAQKAVEKATGVTPQKVIAREWLLFVGLLLVGIIGIRLLYYPSFSYFFPIDTEEIIKVLSPYLIVIFLRSVVWAIKTLTAKIPPPESSSPPR